MDKRRFSDRKIIGMLAPLLLDQLLLRVVGLADSFIISFTGEASVSGVALMDNFSQVFLLVFLALSSGGAVIVSQYLGSGSKEKASEAATQLLLLSALFSAAVSALVFLFRDGLIGFLYGRVEKDVRDAALLYLTISIFSFPALALYNSGAALYRSIGRTKVTMYISAVSNAVNLIGNLIGVFVLKAGVAGVAYPTLISRWLSALVITFLCSRSPDGVGYLPGARWDWKLIRRISHIAVPNALESGTFQLVKVATSAIVALFGTVQIAANGIAQTFWNLSCLVSVSASPVFITVIGQCMGAGEKEEAEWYMRRLLKLTEALSVAWNALFLAVAFPVLSLYAVSEETRRLTGLLLLIHNIGNAFIFPFYEPLGKGLRAAGDVRFTLAVSLVSSLLGRLLFSVIFGYALSGGVIGVAFSMVLDWVIRSSFFLMRFRSGKWKEFKVI